MITENLLADKPFDWVDVQEPTEKDIERLSTEFNLPYLLILDCLKPEHLPKYEETDDGHFLMMRSYDSAAPQDATTVQELTRKIALLITDKRIVSIHRVDLAYIDRVDEKCKKPSFPKNLQALVHQIILEVIRSYEEPIGKLQDYYDEFEDDVLSKDCQLSTVRIYHFRRQLFVMKRILKQTNDSLYHFREFWDDEPSMLQDLRENIDQLYFHLDEVSSNFEHLFQLHVSLNDQRANNIMKTLTVFSSVLLPLNFMASFYGMNFPMLPGLQSEAALTLLCISMVLVAIIALLFFHYRGWFKFRKE